MADTYKGDSPGKKLTRYRFWGQTRILLGEDRFQSGRFLVLAGREGADIRCLRAQGIDESRIVAVDRDINAATRVALEYDCDVECGDLVTVATQSCYRQAFDAVLLDFCAPISPRLVSQVARVAAFCLRDRGILGAGFMYGREGSRSVRAALGPIRAFMDEQHTDENFAEWRQRAPHLFDGCPYDRLPDVAPRIREAAAASGTRAMIYSLLIQDKMDGRPALAYSVGSLRYHSRTSAGHGVPMIYFAHRVHRLRKRLRWQERQRKVVRLGVRSDRTGESFYALTPDAVSDCEKLVRNVAIKAARASCSATAADILNLRTSTVAAWLAHDTMGTYAKESA